MSLPFVKVHGAGNDFVLLPDLDDALVLDEGLVRALCDRHRGLGGDGVLRVAPARPGVAADVFMDYRNADGGVAEMCGNGVRCVAKWWADRAGVDDVRVDTRAGVKVVRCERGSDGRVHRCSVDMGVPVVGKVGALLDVDGDQVEVTTVSMGNPHAVVVVPDVATARLHVLGPRLGTHPAFPEGTNVEVIATPSRDRIAGRIWERGVGETLASGTGAAAMAVAAAVLGLAERRVAVEVPGGTLEVTWEDEGLIVAGPAVEVAAGALDAGWRDGS